VTAAAFAVRGVIEGFYGRPWSHDQRLDMLEFMAAHGFNAYFYAPKDDPALREDWPRPYSGRQRERLADLVRHARSRGIGFVYCLSPGLSLCYSSAADLRDLTDKLDSVARLGVRDFALLLDDIPDFLSHAADLAAFEDRLEAQLALLGAVWAHLSPDASLTVCPTAYWGPPDAPEWRRLGSGLDPRVDLFWTGRAVCSQTLDLDDAAAFTRAAKRPPLYWDNYPVNDAAMAGELHIGPYQGRDRRLYRFSRGIVANAMEYPQASKLALATVGEYLADPEGYQPEAAARRAVAELAGPVDQAALWRLNQACRWSCLSPGAAPETAEALERFRFGYRCGDRRAAATALAAHAAALVEAAEALATGPQTDLLVEARPWVEAFGLGAQALRAIAQLALAGRLDESAEELSAHRRALAERGRRVFGDALDAALAELADSSRRRRSA
jgi:hyaluronoglucosaminidase